MTVCDLTEKVRNFRFDSWKGRYLCKLPKGGPLKYFSYQHDVCTYESENNKDAFNDAVCHYSVNMHLQLSSRCHYCHCD